MIKIKRIAGKRQSVPRNHPWKNHQPQLFKSHNEAIDGYDGDKYMEGKSNLVGKSGTTRKAYRNVKGKLSNKGGFFSIHPLTWIIIIGLGLAFWAVVYPMISKAVIK